MWDQPSATQATHVQQHGGWTLRQAGFHLHREERRIPMPSDSWPLEKRCLFTAHTHCRPIARHGPSVRFGRIARVHGLQISGSNTCSSSRSSPLRLNVASGSKAVGQRSVSTLVSGRSPGSMPSITAGQFRKTRGSARNTASNTTLRFIRNIV